MMRAVGSGRGTQNVAHAAVKLDRESMQEEIRTFYA